jgi:hypothetical protein
MTSRNQSGSEVSEPTTQSRARRGKGSISPGNDDFPKVVDHVSGAQSEARDSIQVTAWLEMVGAARELLQLTARAVVREAAPGRKADGRRLRGRRVGRAGLERFAVTEVVTDVQFSGVFGFGVALPRAHPGETSGRRIVVMTGGDDAWRWP